MLQVELKALLGLCYMRGIQGANLNHIKVRVTTTSVVDPNTLNLDPDPEFRTNFGPDLRVMLSVLKK